MDQQGLERRLTTILVADVVGYSRLMALDEAGTLARLKAHRKELIEPKTADYRGRVVKLIGDGTLMEFGSVVDAVNFAVAVQESLAVRDADVPDDRRIIYRIGINIGDVIVDGDDIYGDGVNVAARLEGLASPGRICISQSVHAQIKGKVKFDYEDMGEQKVKNIPDPVRVYRIAANRPRAAGARPRAETHAADDKPSIAVLPFANMSGDPEQEYFADGISEDITTDLSKISGLLVIARNSAFAYKGQSPDIRQVCRDLGVRYVLEGSVRKSGSRVRINAQMIDGSTGGHVWAERYDRSVEDVFAVQDEVTRAIIDALTVELADDERARREDRRKVNPEAYDCLLRARECFNQLNEISLKEARIVLLSAIELDPELAACYATLAVLHIVEFLNKWNDPAPDYLDRALELARQACSMDKNEPRAFYALAHSHMWLRNLDEAEPAAQRALELDPNFAAAFAALGLVRDYSGRHEEAIGLFEHAMKLDPQYTIALQYIGRSLFALERYEEAERAFTRRLIHSPRSDMTRSYLASLYGHTGRIQDAQRVWREVMEIKPDFSVDHIRRVLPFREASWFDRFDDGLTKAGLPE